MRMQENTRIAESRRSIVCESASANAGIERRNTNMNHIHCIDASAGTDQQRGSGRIAGLFLCRGRPSPDMAPPQGQTPPTLGSRSLLCLVQSDGLAERWALHTLLLALIHTEVCLYIDSADVPNP